jgi:hypothetical protein
VIKFNARNPDIKAHGERRNTGFIAERSQSLIATTPNLQI